MEYRELKEVDLDEAAELALLGHGALRAALPFLPQKTASDFRQRLTWALGAGFILGAYEGDSLRAFMGGFRLDGFRNAGPGFYSPDWCHGLSPGAEAEAAYRGLYAAVAPMALEAGCKIHALGISEAEPKALETFSLLGFGRIMMEAAIPLAELRRALAQRSGARAQLRRAKPADGPALARLNAELSAHIGSSPILFPHPQGMGAEDWEEWLGDQSHVCVLAMGDGEGKGMDGEPLGFVKAQEAQLDVSYSIHDQATLAINGMFVQAKARRRGLAALLVAALAEQGLADGKRLMSVDCETANAEAYAFWTGYFRVFAWSLERRVG